MRIVHIIDTLTSGGRERQLVELLKGLSKDETITCDLIIMSNDVHYTYLNELGITVHKVIRKSQNDVSVFFRLYRLLTTINPDILHSWGSMCSVYSLPVVILKRICFVNGFLRNAPPTLNWKNKDWIRCKMSFPVSDVIISNSFAGLRAYSVPTEEACCIYNGFDFNRIESLEDPSEVRARLGVNTKYIVGMVASFSNKKDYLSFVSSALNILSNRQDVTFIAVGDGVKRNECEEIIPPDLKRHFIFTGKILDTESIINIFDIGVLLSNIQVHGEGISNAIMEYMALGKPVIASDSGGNKEIVKNGETGFITFDNGINDVSEKINKLLNDKTLSSSLGKAGFKRLKLEFDFSALVGNYMNMYTNVLSKRKET